MAREYFCVFKIFTSPKKDLSITGKSELKRKKQIIYNSETPTSVLKTLNPHMCNIEYIYRCILQRVTIEGKPTLQIVPGKEKVVTFEEFIPWAIKYDNLVTWIGWNCLSYDIPFLSINTIKQEIELPLTPPFGLFAGRKYYKSPVFDLQGFLYNFNYPSSLILTADGFDIPVDLKFLDSMYLENVFDRDDKELMQDYVRDLGSLIKELFVKTFIYYF